MWNKYNINNAATLFFKFAPWLLMTHNNKIKVIFTLIVVFIFTDTASYLISSMLDAFGEETFLWKWRTN